MLEYATIIALMIMFVHNSFTKGNIFEKIGNFVKVKLGEYWSKPVVSCSVCMCPYWGLLIYLLGVKFEVFILLPIYAIILMLFTAAGLNVVLTYIVESDKEVIKELKDK